MPVSLKDCASLKLSFNKAALFTATNPYCIARSLLSSWYSMLNCLFASTVLVSINERVAIFFSESILLPCAFTSKKEIGRISAKSNIFLKWYMENNFTNERYSIPKHKTHLSNKCNDTLRTKNIIIVQIYIQFHN